jgi:hypothetical protein
MSVSLSRRQSLKLIAGAGLLSVFPLKSAYSREREFGQAFIVTDKAAISETFRQVVNKSLITSSLHIAHNQYESLTSLAQIPENSLIIGLVSDAEKVLIDAIVHDRRGHIQTTARTSESITHKENISRLAEMTVQAATKNSNKEYFDSVQEGQRITTGSLISFYAYL